MHGFLEYSNYSNGERAKLNVYSGKIKLSGSELSFFLGYFLYSTSSVVIGNSNLFGANRFTIANVVSYIAAILILISFCMRKHKVSEFMIRILVGVFVFLIGYNIHSIGIGVCALLIMASEKIDSERIVKFCVFSNIFFLMIVIFPALLGLIPNDIYYHNGVLAYSLGFSYYSNVPYAVFMITLFTYWLTKKKNEENLVLLLSVPVNLLCYKFCTVRLTLYCYIIFIALAVLFKFTDFTKKSKWRIALVSGMFPLVAIFVIAISLLKNRFPIIQALDAALNYRLGFNLQGFQKYGISLFGKKIEAVAEYWDANNINHYFFIDCGYVYTLLCYGIILFAIILFLYSFLSNYAMKKHDSKLLIICIIICVFSVVNNVLFNFSLNPLPLVAFNLARIYSREGKIYAVGEPKRISDN